MTHPQNMLTVDAVPWCTALAASTRCSDLPTPDEWLRALAGNLAMLRTWWAVPMVLAHLLVHVADLVHFWRVGQTAVLYPMLTGGSDHSARAVLANRNPMVCRGDFTTGIACSVRHRKRAPSVVVWAAPRRRVLTSVRVSSRGHVACFDPGKVTA